MARGWLAVSETVVSARDRCGDVTCQVVGAIRCSYVDRRGRACRTAWCASHWSVVLGRQYCRRHATVVEALGGASDAGGLPDVDNRAASLAGWVGRELDPAVRGVLQRVSPPGGGNLVIDDVRLLLTPGGRTRRWVRAWKLVDHRGVINKVAIEVDEADDSEVLARVETSLIGHGVPPWIQRRRDGTRVSAAVDAEERRAFSDAIARSIELVLTRQETVQQY